MYHIVAEAKVRDAERAARRWAEACGQPVVQRDLHVPILQRARQWLAALSVTL